MKADWMLAGELLCQIMFVAVPIYLVVFKARFWSAFFFAWLLLCAAESLSVHRGWLLYDEDLSANGSIPADFTNIGLVIFSGWLLAHPYCLILTLIRKGLIRYTLLRPLEQRDGLAARHQPKA